MHALLEYATERIRTVAGLRLVGTAANKGGILSFVMDQAHAHDIGSILDQAGVAIRSGHHCTMPLMQRFQVPATARASIAIYNGRDDIDQLIDALRTVARLFA
jgi:cysteine desulfurase / selenocysteine lyase